MIFVLHQVIEECWEQRYTQHIAFIDYTKEFHMMNCETLWVVLTNMGYPPNFISIVKALYTDVKVRISVNGKLTAPVVYKWSEARLCTCTNTIHYLHCSHV